MELNLVEKRFSQGTEPSTRDHEQFDEHWQTSSTNRALAAHVISMSLPNSPAKLLEEGQARKVGFDAEVSTNEPVVNAQQAQNGRSISYSQPLNKQTVGLEARSVVDGVKSPKANRGTQNNYALFKTKSGKIERQISRMSDRSELQTSYDEELSRKGRRMQSVPTKRYYDAFKGPELEDLRESEELILPRDETWPFLLRFPISCFGICLGVASQAILYKNLATVPSMKFLHMTPIVNMVLWCFGLFALLLITFTYFLKCICYFEAVRREYYHPVRINFFFAPWIASMFLAIGLPPVISEKVHPSVWCVFMAPLFCLELKIYGQWMSSGQRRLSRVANPSNHLSIVGNFVGALLGASSGWREGAIFFFAVGLAHYFVVFVTLYQRLPTNETLPNELHPVFFLFIAAPSVASVAWEKITGEFGYVSRIAYFIALFLYSSLVVRINFFRGFSFNISWWAYTFPMTGAAIATIRYSNEVRHPFTRVLAVLLSTVSSITVTSLLITTLFKAFVTRSLFPNDSIIAIAHKKKHKQPNNSKENGTESNFTIRDETCLKSCF